MRSSFLLNPQVLVVEASAGSGKTYALAKRYVQLVLALAGQGATPLQSILAITFTNKATLGMKSRILDFLKRIALKQLKPLEVHDILGPLGLDEQKASSLSFAVMSDVIRQYHYFQVQTIDSFINALLCGCSFKIGLSARFKIQRNSKEYLQLSIDELLQEAHTDQNTHRLFEDFIRQYLFLENRWGWFPKEDLLKTMAVLFAQYNTYQKPFVVYPFNENLFVKKRKIYALMRALSALCPPETDKRFFNHLEGFLASHDGAFDVDDLKSYWANEEFPLNKGGEVTSQLRKTWQQLHQEIGELCLVESRTMFNAYIVVFEALLAHFDRLAQRDDVLFLEELNRKAAALFDDGRLTVEELYFRLAARFRHYLIDEFQDTSLAQWRNLSLMVHEALASGGSLFYVGDKKQAIYAFRGGESRLFDALQSQLVDFNVQTQALDKNYRSCPNIIAFNNRVFNAESLRGFLQRKAEDDRAHKRKEVYFSDEDFQAIANAFAFAHQVSGKGLKGGVVRVAMLDGKIKQERAADARQRLMTLVHELRGRFALKEIAILTRGNREVEEITRWLLQEGIYAQSERSSDIKNNSLIQELMALLAFLHSPIDNNAFAQFCLGELMPKATGLSPQTLRGFLFDCARRKDQAKEMYFYKHFRETFPQVWSSLFEDFFRQVGACPLYELTASIMARFACDRHFPQYQGFCMHLLELVKGREVDSCDLAFFLEYYENFEGEDRFVPMAEVEAVKVLTVHKAKGLEFSVVIVPFLEMDIKVGAGGREGTLGYVLDIHQEGMGLIRLKESYRQFCPLLQARYEEEYKKAFLMELNAVYVALTRAIEELYVFVPARVGNAVNPARFLIPQDCWAIGKAANRPAAHEPQEPRRRIKPFVQEPWLPRLREEFLSHPPPASAVLAREGEFYHGLLMRIGNLSEVDLAKALDHAWDQMPHRARAPVSQERALSRLKSLINSGALKKFFYLPSDARVFCEKEFVNAFGDTRRMDRLIVHGTRVWVVDYKASRLGEESHQAQMREYVQMLKVFYPKHKVEGFIVYLNDLRVEECQDIL